MKKFLISIAFCLPLLAVAQDFNDPKFLAGAVTQTDQGVVYFSKTYNVPGKSKAEIFQTLKDFTDTQILHGENALTQCRFVEDDEAEGLLAARVEENLYFKRTAWALHKTRFFYDLVYTVADGTFTVEMRRLHYLYEEQENPNVEPLALQAEDWITDAEALNKKGKLLKKAKNFRVFTILRKDEVFSKAAAAVGAKE